MYSIICPQCNELRQVRAKKPWMKGEPPYSRNCMSCCQIGKIKSAEHRSKLSASVKQLQTKEVRKKKSDFMKQHPELWQANIRKKGDTFQHSAETKKKIGEGVANAKKEQK